MAAVTLTVPPRVSTRLFTGTFSTFLRVVNPLCPGCLIVTVPPAGSTRNEMPCWGSRGGGGTAAFAGSMTGPTGSEALHSEPMLFSWVRTRMKCPRSEETIV